MGARERIAAAYRAEIQCLNLTLGDFAALKSKIADLETRLANDEASFKDWQARKEDELARQEAQRASYQEELDNLKANMPESPEETLK